MPIPIHREPGGEPPYEACCFCRAVTPWWTALPKKIVACCPKCAARGEPADVPTKKAWCRREHIAHRPTIGEIHSGLDREYPPAPVVEPPV